MTLDTYRVFGETLRPICAFFWISTYLLIIHRGNEGSPPRHAPRGPRVNICWEGIFSFIYMPDDPRVLAAWGTCFFLDVVILVQVYRFGRSGFAIAASASTGRAILILSLVSAFMVLMGFTAQFKDRLGWFTGFLQNLLMSCSSWR